MSDKYIEYDEFDVTTIGDTNIKHLNFLKRVLDNIHSERIKVRVIVFLSKVNSSYKQIHNLDEKYKIYFAKLLKNDLYTKSEKLIEYVKLHTNDTRNIQYLQSLLKNFITMKYRIISGDHISFVIDNKREISRINNETKRQSDSEEDRGDL